MIATVGLGRVPVAWIDQTRDGGRLLVSLDRRSCGGLTAFREVTDHQGTTGTTALGVEIATDDGTHTVRQGGPRRLWDAIEHACDEWQRLGQPVRERFGLTVEHGHHALWLDEPASPYTWVP